MKDSTPSKRGRQPGLFHLANPLVMRFGAEFFTALPRQPGVYRFFDGTGRLLYIGQSACLRDRLGSYRHVTPERHPRRTLRLVARIQRIEWEACTTALEAIELERILLLEHRPPFNRAGTWQGPPWWLAMETSGEALVVGLRREEGVVGPLLPAFRHVFGSVARCLYRVAWPELPFHRYPAGLMKPLVPVSLRLPLARADEAMQIFANCAVGNVETLLAGVDQLPAPPSPQMEEFWTAERDQLADWVRKARPYEPVRPTPSRKPREEHPLLF
ncbi:nucleotide excision repair endonuclease [Luteolibacter luteus]|uniref:Nucleotide excision repair endonuclease n=1 Tax=Luteolibacter luteus TaxID=2728835 RepID=A0A858RP97_9BACT|nr:nucleotide excision repair endonuclease [Luteolibacter luteus]QJE98169.1 nucleotide excision repair endonuclease [Luteolibacter luteus]